MTKKMLLLTGLVFGFFMMSASGLFATVAPGWQKHVIGEMTSPIYLDVIDMDGDGDLDVASTTNLHPGLFDSEVAWFQNNLNESGEWEKIVISSNAGENSPITNSNGIAVADIDGDGINDVAVCTGRVTEIIGDVYWFKGPDDPAGEWKRFDIEVDAMNSYFKLYTMDVNEDGLLDLLVGGNQGAVVFMNPGDPALAGAVWEKIAFPEDEGETGSSFYLDDINGDGKVDVLNTYTGAVTDDPGNASWFDMGYDVMASQVLFDRTMIDPELTRAFDINCMDINGDSKKDVICTVFQQPEVYWYEAPAEEGGEWMQHLISDTYEGTDIYTGDINADGTDDVIISGLFKEKISWFEYGMAQDSWTENLLDDDILIPGDITLDDLDGDGDLDVVLAGMGVNQMIWYENQLKEDTVCNLTSIVPGRIKTGLGFLPRFKMMMITGSEDIRFCNDSQVDMGTPAIKVLYSRAITCQIMQVFVMVMGADPGTYDVSVDGCTGVSLLIE